MLPLSTGCMIILVSRFKVLIANLSTLVMFDLSGLTFSCVCLIFYLSSSGWALEIFKICMMVVAKLRLSTDISEALNYWLLILIIALIKLWLALLILLLCSFICASFWACQTMALWNSLLNDITRPCWIVYLAKSNIILQSNVLVCSECSCFSWCFLH